ncbi:MAG: hypothetical protein PUE13_09235 [Clostridiales bacterium]|nr:hypothetical protein [Clostridiales bacterium]
MICTKRSLPYVRQYVIVAVYDILDKDGVQYKKTDASTIVAKMSVYGNKSVFSISVSEQISGTELIVSLVQPYEGLSGQGMERAVTAVADRISQYLENEMVLNISGT